MDREVEEGQGAVRDLAAPAVGVEGPRQSMAIGMAGKGLTHNSEGEATPPPPTATARLRLSVWELFHM